jgi:hypothetical protein
MGLRELSKYGLKTVGLVAFQQVKAVFKNVSDGKKCLNQRWALWGVSIGIALQAVSEIDRQAFNRYWTILFIIRYLKTKNPIS